MISDKDILLTSFQDLSQSESFDINENVLHDNINSFVSFEMFNVSSNKNCVGEAIKNGKTIISYKKVKKY